MKRRARMSACEPARRRKRLARAVALSALTACGGAPSHVAHPPPPHGVRGAWSYEATLRLDEGRIDVAATFAPGTGEELSVTEGAEPFVKNVSLESGTSRTSIEPRNGSWFVPACENGCRLHYEFDVHGAARVLGADATARRLGVDTYEAPPPTWLLHPLELPLRATYRLRVASRAPDLFATGVARARDGAYEAPIESLPFAPYTVMGPIRVRDVPIPRSTRGGAAHLRVAFAPGPMKTSDEDLTRWLVSAASAVRDYYGMYPIDDALVVVVPHGRRSVGYGRTMAGGGASILIDVGTDTVAKDLEDDWVAVHEMIHLAFPSVQRDSLWIEEGLATYLEPLVRARAGMLDPHEVWEEFGHMMQNGLPQEGDEGLDRTHTWGRIYWGGALFCLVADVAIREATHGEKSIDDAVRGILAAGGNDAARWSTSYAFSIGDKATGTHVLSDLYAKWGLAPGTVDLDALFARLGVAVTTKDVVLDDDAPLAAVRREMTRAP